MRITPVQKRKRIAYLFRVFRSKGFVARVALSYAKTKFAWDRREDSHRVPISEHLQNDCKSGAVRLRIVPDDISCADDLFGDTYSHKANPDIPESRLERERKAEIDRVNRDGVWGVIGEYFDGEEWQHADSCFGFIGDDWKGSGYDLDIMASTLVQSDAVRVCKACKRPIANAVRP